MDDGPIGGDGDLVLTAEDEDEEEGEWEGDGDDEDEDAYAAEQAAVRRAMHPTVVALPTELLLPPSHAAAGGGTRPCPMLPWGPLPARLRGLAGVGPEAFVGHFELLDELAFDDDDDSDEEGDWEDDDEEGADGFEDGEQQGGAGATAFFLEAGGLLPSSSSSSSSSSTAAAVVAEDGMFAGKALPDLTAAAGATRQAQRASAFGPMRFAGRFFFADSTAPAAAGAGGRGRQAGVDDGAALLGAAGLPTMLLPRGQGGDGATRTVRALLGDLLSVLDHRRASGGAAGVAAARRGEDEDDEGRK